MSHPPDPSTESGLSAMDPPTEDTPVEPAAPPASEGRGPRSRWLRRGALLLGALVVSPAAVGALSLAPFVVDDLRLDRAVRVAALDWRDFGEEAGLTRLQYEMDHQRLGMQVGDEDCALSEQDRHKRIECAWGVQVVLPGTELRLPVRFASRVEVNPKGELRPAVWP